MKLRYYAEADTGVDHRRTLELLEEIAEEHAIPVEVVQVDPKRAPPADFPGETEVRDLADAWDDFTYNPTLQEGLGDAPSRAFPDRADIVGNVGIVVDGDLVWATRYWGTHHGWGPVDEGETAIGFLEEVQARGLPAIAERVPIDDWSPADADPAEPAPRDDIQQPTREAIREICTAQSFQRGVNYYEEGRVRDVTVEGREVTARVRGSREYRTTVDLSSDGFDPWCSCPYDYAGECKHVVAVLLTVADQLDELFAASTDDEGQGADDQRVPSSSVEPDLEEVLAGADPETLRAFLEDALAGNDDLRERFLAFVDVPTEKSLADYKRDVNRRFEDAVGRRGIVEYDTRLQFNKYYELAETYRARGNSEQALEIYRALAEGIRENLDRIDDSSGHYGDAIERAVEAYADCLEAADPDQVDRSEHIEYCFEQFESAEFTFVREYYDEALRKVCVTEADLEQWLSLLEPHVPKFESELSVTATDEADSIETAKAEAEGAESDDKEEAWVLDPTQYHLDPDVFTGGVLEIDHLDVGPLDVRDFIGETLAEQATREIASADETASTTDDTTTNETSPWDGRLSPWEQALLSSYLHVLEELDERDALERVLEEVYDESTTFYRQYVDLLLADGRDDRAGDVIEEGLDAFRFVPDIQRLAADFYRERDPERYREVLQTLVVRHEDWEAYEELEQACSDDQWESTRHAIVTQLGRLDPEQLIDLYLHDSESEKAFSKVLDSEELELFRRYRSEVADIDPEAYFEAYRECLEPYLADDTGRDHYRTVIDHLRELDEIGLKEPFEGFLDRLREKHSNRPAFLDELEQAGF